MWFTSDNHFFHKNIINIQKDTRGNSATIEGLHEAMIVKWNSQVSIRDLVYIVGDFCFGSVEQTDSILARLKGNKVLIVGNHDNRSKKSTKFNSVHDYLEIKIDDIKVCMSHYPFASWNRMHYGSFMLHGHTHGNYTGEGRIMDVGIDTRTDLGLYSWDEVYGRLITKPVIPHHEKE